MNPGTLARSKLSRGPHASSLSCRWLQREQSSSEPIERRRRYASRKTKRLRSCIFEISTAFGRYEDAEHTRETVRELHIRVLGLLHRLTALHFRHLRRRAITRDGIHRRQKGPRWFAGPHHRASRRRLHIRTRKSQRPVPFNVLYRQTGSNCFRSMFHDP